MPLHIENLKDAPVHHRTKPLTESLCKIAEGLAEFAERMEFLQSAGVLPDELKDAAREASTPVAKALIAFQRTVHPERRMEFIYELRRYGVKI